MKWVENLSNANKVAYMGCVSIILSVLLYWLVDKYDGSLLDLNGFWTFYTLIVSSPVAFIIWQFRDKNATQQIENSRKDTNLKEFQKLAEWVSGIHLIEEKISIKTKYESDSNDQINKIIEKTREYSMPSDELAIQTHSKVDGAVGLQIAAVYNLLPFYRGDHGESFKKPALNLLTSAWLALQRTELTILDKFEVSMTKISEKKIRSNIEKLQKNAKSPLGIAITRVLLSLNKQSIPCLLEHKEVFPGLRLAGMDFHVHGVDPICLSIFKDADCTKINMIGSNMFGADLRGANLLEANLTGADFTSAKLTGTNLSNSKLQFIDLSGSDLENINLENSNLNKANFTNANISETALIKANWQHAILDEDVLIKIILE